MSDNHQAGPVEQGQPPVVHMDLDLALAVIGGHTEGSELDAERAIRALADRARQYVAGPTSGRLAALCQVLQEPVPTPPEVVNAETVVQAYLTERNLITMTKEAARRLGVDGSFW